MCTVTFIPSKEGIVITHNRDEKLSRQASELPQVRSHFGKQLVYPRDPDKNGTWFCSDENHRVACILNGAFEKHISNPPYRKSRGLIVLEAFAENTFHHWVQSVNLLDIEPFTLLLFEPNKKLIELRWDGIKKHVAHLEIDQVYIWSSATLYSKEAKSKREQWLTKWLNEKEPTADSMLDFHNYGGDGKEDTNLKMEILGSHKTVSLTQFFFNGTNNFFDHHNFVTNKKQKISL